MPPLIPQIGSKSIPSRRTALKKDGQDTLIYLSILLIGTCNKLTRLIDVDCVIVIGRATRGATCPASR